jgi:hypothetical protein
MKHQITGLHDADRRNRKPWKAWDVLERYSQTRSKGGRSGEFEDRETSRYCRPGQSLICAYKVPLCRTLLTPGQSRS